MIPHRVLSAFQKTHTGIGKKGVSCRAADRDSFEKDHFVRWPDPYPTYTDWFSSRKDSGWHTGIVEKTRPCIREGPAILTKFIILMYGIKFFRPYKNLRPVEKNAFRNIERFLVFLPQKVLKKYSLFLQIWWMGYKKNPSFHTDFKNVNMILVKKVHQQKVLV